MSGLSGNRSQALKFVARRWLAGQEGATVTRFTGDKKPALEHTYKDAATGGSSRAPRATTVVVWRGEGGRGVWRRRWQRWRAGGGW